MKRVVVVLVWVACGGKEPAPVAPPPSNNAAVPDAGVPDAAMDEVESVMATMTAYRDEMCKCLDKACADAVQDRMTKWSTKMAREAGDRPSRKATEAELEQMTEIGRGYGECMGKLLNAP